MVTTADAPAVDSTFLDAVMLEHTSRVNAYDEIEKWIDGRQQVHLSARMRQFLTDAGIPDTEFSDNYLDLVVSALTDRLRVAGFSAPGEKAEPRTDAEGLPIPDAPGPLAQYAADTWSANRGDSLQIAVHDTAVALGDAYVIVEWDALAGRPALHFNDPRLVRMHRDPANTSEVLFASKAWVVSLGDGKATRLNLYYPERIERYISNGEIVRGAWRPFQEDGTSAVVPWTMDGSPDGEPIGIAVVQFSNDRRGNATYGRTEVHNAIPLQRAMNKALVDMLRVSDAQGWPQRYATGVATSDADLNADPGSVWEIESDLAKVGQLEASDPAGIISLLNKLQEDVATVTRTPQHLVRITGAFPSGESIKTAEAPLVKKAQKRQTSFGNGHEDVMLLAARLGVANGALAGDVPLSGYTCEWEDAESRPAELDHISAINSKQGISRRQRWREYGYTDEEIARMEAELESEAADLAEVMADALDTEGGRPGQQMRGRRRPPPGAGAEA